MPEEDDDALGQMLGDRIKGTKGDAEDEEQDDTEEPSSDAESESAADSDASEATSQENTRSAQITQSADTPSVEDEEEDEPEPEPESETEEGTVRSRSPFPLYVTPDLKETVQDRFEKFNAQRTLNDEAQVEKHKHFMEGLLRAGLDYPDLEEYVLDEFKDDEQ